MTSLSIMTVFLSDIDDCAHVTCQHSGSCIDHVNNYTCECVKPYHGRNCEIGEYHHLNIMNHSSVMSSCISCNSGAPSNDDSKSKYLSSTFPSVPNSFQVSEVPIQKPYSLISNFLCTLNRVITPSF